MIKKNTYFQYHLNGKNTCKDVIKVGQVQVLGTLLINRILCGQGYGAGNNYDHDEAVEEMVGHDRMHGTSKSEKKESVKIINQI